jgi:hypothetical protein
MAAKTLTREHQDLLDALDTHREFLRTTLRGLTDEQAGQRPTVSELCIGGLVKHVGGVEWNWVDFILHGPSAIGFDGSGEGEDGGAAAERWAQFQMAPGETVDDVLAAYDRVAMRTDEVIASIDDLGMAQPLPEAPWFEPGAEWSVRRVVMHIIAETAQHAGHADILRETIDGQKTMG